MSDGGGRDPQIVRAYEFAHGLQASPYLSVNAGYLGRDGQGLQTSEHLLHERLSLRSASIVSGTMNAVQQLAHGDDADRVPIAVGNSAQRFSPAL